MKNYIITEKTAEGYKVDLYSSETSTLIDKIVLFSAKSGAEVGSFSPQYRYFALEQGGHSRQVEGLTFKNDFIRKLKPNYKINNNYYILTGDNGFYYPTYYITLYINVDHEPIRIEKLQETSETENGKTTFYNNYKITNCGAYFSELHGKKITAKEFEANKEFYLNRGFEPLDYKIKGYQKDLEKAEKGGHLAEILAKNIETLKKEIKKGYLYSGALYEPVTVSDVFQKVYIREESTPERAQKDKNKAFIYDHIKSGTRYIDLLEALGVDLGAVDFEAILNK